jgi:broad specificity phosphatase PhoE
VTEAWLLRHGEVASYDGDHGLTERGAAQATAAGEHVADQLGGEHVAVRCAPSGRASGTAEQVVAALRSAGVDPGEVVVDTGFENFRVQIDGEVVPHDAMRPELRRADPARQAWAAEVARFARIHDGGGDPITWWLTQPTLAFEPAAIVVRRLWRALTTLPDPLTVVCTHSGPMRALAAHAIGYDPGEPEHLERVTVRLDGDAAELTYRDATVKLAVPEQREPAWN